MCMKDKFVGHLKTLFQVDTYRNKEAKNIGKFMCSQINKIRKSVPVIILRFLPFLLELEYLLSIR